MRAQCHLQWHPGKRLSYALMTGCLSASVAGCTVGQDKISHDDRLALATIGGAVAGALIGYEVTGSNARYLYALGLGAVGGFGAALLVDQLTEFDRAAMQEATYHSLQNGATGETKSWSNTRSGTQGSITPLRTFLDSQGRICRLYDAEVSIDGETRTARETACLTEAGHWVVSPTSG